MSNLKYYSKDQIKKMNLVNRIKANKLNKAYFRMCDKKYKDLLTINGYPLDEYQRKVVFSEEKYTMVIAGAGSGKSTTMIGKIKYLINVKNINPKEIVAISFTNESVNSLKESLEKNNIFNINVTTFHKLALTFLDNKPIIKEDCLEYIVKEYLYMNQYTSKSLIILKAFNKISYQSITSNIDNNSKSIIKILNMCHTNNYQIKDFLKVKDKIPFWNKKQLLCLLYIIMDLYYLYIEEKEAVGKIDFDDMIINATFLIKDINISFKHIIVDEYQDTSLIRVKFLQELINKCHANLTVVGDDYQSIYKFNGCDLNIFLNFYKYFPNPQIFKLQNTYRNSQELINISKGFILKNPYQIKKKLVSNKHLNNPIRIVYYKNNQEQKLLELTSTIESKYGKVLILGRNNYDLSKITSKELNYLTVHKSKGLEEDNIIIINLEDSMYGLPNKVIDLPIEKYLFNHKNNYPYDEERRLFYVALTRTKNYVFLFVNKNNESAFVKEIKKNLK